MLFRNSELFETNFGKYIIFMFVWIWNNFFTFCHLFLKNEFYLNCSDFSSLKANRKNLTNTRICHFFAIIVQDVSLLSAENPRFNPQLWIDLKNSKIYQNNSVANEFDEFFYDNTRNYLKKIYWNIKALLQVV